MCHAAGYSPTCARGKGLDSILMEERDTITIQDEYSPLLLAALEDIGEAKAMAKRALEYAEEALRMREESHLVFEGIRSTIKTFLSIISLCTFSMGIIRAVPLIASWLGR